MLKPPDNGQTTSATDRVVALDRARTFITLLVVLYHSAINYTHFGIGGDRMRWLGFDVVVLFCDSFFMACMFFISGLFVHNSISRRGASNYLASRAFRLGLPFLISIFMLMPIAYYRYYHQQFDFLHYYAHMVAVGPWSAGSAWFLWVLLAFDAIAVAIFIATPRAISALGRPVDGVRDRPLTAFTAFALFSIAIYLRCVSQSGNRTGRRSATIRSSSRPAARRSMPHISWPALPSALRAYARVCWMKAARSRGAGGCGSQSRWPATPRSFSWFTSTAAA